MRVLPDDRNYHLLAAFRSGVDIPPGLILVAGIGCLFMPLLFYTLSYLIFGVVGGSVVNWIETFLVFGIPFGLVALLLALPLAHYANRRGVNG